MTTEEQLKSSFYKSMGMLSIVPPVVAAGVTLKVTQKAFEPYWKRRR
jgi:hypothetical protein